MPGRKGVFIWYEDAVQFQLLTDAQLGRLIRILIKYSQHGEQPKFDDPVLEMAFSFMAARDDRENDRYAKICEERRIAGKKGGRPKKANGFSENQKVFEESNQKQKKLTSTLTPDPALTSTPALTPVPVQESTGDIVGAAEIPASDWAGSNATGAAAPAPVMPAKKAYGQYGWVKLSDIEYGRLSKELGDTELKRCIQYVDESAQTTGNKNKWKDWNLVVRKCHREQWGVHRGGAQASGQRARAGTDTISVLQALHQMYDGDEP